MGLTHRNCSSLLLQQDAVVPGVLARFLRWAWRGFVSIRAKSSGGRGSTRPSVNDMARHRQPVDRALAGATKHWRRVTAIAVASTIGCAAATSPTSATPTLRVSNPLCDSGSCERLYIRARIWAWPIPQGVYRGAKALGEIDGPSGCLQFPAIWTLTLTEVDSAGAVFQQDTLSWTPSDPQGIYLVTRAESIPGEKALALTPTFVPAGASGWELTFTNTGGGFLGYTAHLAPAPQCEPR